jgi:hypothetical protein
MPKPLDELEMFELLQAAYPGQFEGDDDIVIEKALDFVGEIGDFDVLADLLARVIMLAPQLKSPLTGQIYHCLGKRIDENIFSSVVQRDEKGN